MKVADPTWNRNEVLVQFFGSAVRSREDTSRAVEARRAGCETVSVTDSLRPPDRLAQRTPSQNDLSIVHTEKRGDVYVSSMRRHRPSMLKLGDSTRR